MTRKEIENMINDLINNVIFRYMEVTPADNVDLPLFDERHAAKLDNAKQALVNQLYGLFERGTK